MPAKGYRFVARVFSSNSETNASQDLVHPASAANELAHPSEPPNGNYWRIPAWGLSITGLAIIVATVFVVQHLSLKPPRTHASIPAQQSPALPLLNIPSIAVLPFTNLSGDPQQEYFSDGITDDLINSLSRLPGLLVMAPNSTFTYKGKVVKEQQVSRELGVKYVLEGGVQKAGDQVRITAQLGRCHHGHRAVERELRPAAA